MERGIEHAFGNEHCELSSCRHAEVLKNTVRKITHDLSQPIMLLQGHLELMALEKKVLDGESVKLLVDTISKQMEVINGLHGKLRAAVAPVNR